MIADKVLVTVSSVTRPTEPGPHTVLIGHGTLPNGRAVTFAGDWRPMLLLAEAVDQLGEVVTAIEDWQVLA